MHPRFKNRVDNSSLAEPARKRALDTAFQGVNWAELEAAWLKATKKR